MIENIALGALMTILTTAIHGLCTAALIAFLEATHADQWALRTLRMRVLVVATLVLFMFMIAVAESGIWAVVFVAVDAIQTFEEALYFSVVTFTTLGYGDVTVSEKWRLLASLEAAVGTIMFGWTTALIVSASNRLYFRKRNR